MGKKGKSKGHRRGRQDNTFTVAAKRAAGQTVYDDPLDDGSRVHERADAAYRKLQAQNPDTLVPLDEIPAHERQVIRADGLPITSWRNPGKMGALYVPEREQVMPLTDDDRAALALAVQDMDTATIEAADSGNVDAIDRILTAAKLHYPSVAQMAGVGASGKVVSWGDTDNILELAHERTGERLAIDNRFRKAIASAVTALGDDVRAQADAGNLSAVGQIVREAIAIDKLAGPRSPAEGEFLRRLNAGNPGVEPPTTLRNFPGGVEIPALAPSLGDSPELIMRGITELTAVPADIRIGAALGDPSAIRAMEKAGDERLAANRALLQPGRPWLGWITQDSDVPPEYANAAMERAYNETPLALRTAAEEGDTLLQDQIIQRANHYVKEENARRDKAEKAPALPLPPADVVPRQYSAAVDGWLDAIREWNTPQAYEIARRALPYLPESDREDKRSIDDFMRLQVGMLASSEPAYVAPDICALLEVASRSWDIDARIPLEHRPAEHVWFYFATPMDVGLYRTLHGDLAHTFMVGLLVHALPEGAVAATYFARYPHDAWPVPFGFARLGPASTVRGQSKKHTAILDEGHDDRDCQYSHDRSIDCDKVLSALLAFCGQRLAVQSRGPLHRDVRRRMERERFPAPEVRVITLRKTKQKRADDSDAAPVEWGCHWLVGANEGGHWRTYHRGTPQEFRKWIFPYIKGDLSKVFKPPSKRLFAVAR